MTDSTTDWYSSETATFGDRMAGARAAPGMTQTERAGQLGVRHETIRAREDDLAEPRANRLQMRAGGVNVSMMWPRNGRGDGPDGPADEAPLPGDLCAILTGSRRLTTDMRRFSDRPGALGKRPRTAPGEHG